jgi:hypothetical protein
MVDIFALRCGSSLRRRRDGNPKPTRRATQHATCVMPATKSAVLLQMAGWLSLISLGEYTRTDAKAISRPWIAVAAFATAS